MIEPFTDFAKRDSYLREPAVSGALFGAVAAGRVRRRDGRDFLISPGGPDWGPDLDVTDYIAALEQAGYVVRAGGIRETPQTFIVSADTWMLTDDGEIKASEYALEALHHPHVLEMRKAWAAMSGALLRLAQHEQPTVEQLATVGPAHATLLLGHHALHGQVATVHRRHRRAIEMVEEWMDTFRKLEGHRGFTAESWAAYRILAFLRGEDLSTLETPPQLREPATT